MGRALKRQFLHKNPWCQICAKSGAKVRSSAIEYPGIAVCGVCAAKIQAMRENMRKVQEAKAEEAEEAVETEPAEAKE